MEWRGWTKIIDQGIAKLAHFDTILFDGRNASLRVFINTLV